MVSMEGIVSKGDPLIVYSACLGSKRVEGWGGRMNSVTRLYTSDERIDVFLSINVVSKSGPRQDSAMSS